ncbi:unnamed protein product [[Actinomadura] parvosata subsp. kistnae]|uniref:hypothetical protein n=1 Tax=[Actinomadura] parvosata TaxID=1955412 RepID=UPI000D2EBF8F|nr:hypothetical protein [Nonomuraea sp. ATCC 55076]SPL95738.1 unnamed protein product [Actinomadura parvosata subsp. kistnae]
MGRRLDEARAELHATQRRLEVEEARLLGDADDVQNVIRRLEADGFGPGGYPLCKGS